MDKNTKTLVTIIIVVSIGYGIYKYAIPKPRKSFKFSKNEVTELNPSCRPNLEMPEINFESLEPNPEAENALKVLSGYVAAYNDGLPQKELDELNEEFRKKYMLTVYRRRSDNKLAVRNAYDKDVIVSDI